jgi:hypothetical protein
MRKLAIVLLTAALLLGLAGVKTALSDSDTASHGVTMEVIEIAAMGLNNTNTITLTIDTASSGGASAQDDTDTSKLLQYTSLVSGSTHRSITAQWGSSDVAPDGTQLNLEATSVPTDCGASAGAITLSSTSKPIITGIGSCATGVGPNGAELTYTLSVLNFTQLKAGDNTTVTITYTLTDAS